MGSGGVYSLIAREKVRLEEGFIDLITLAFLAGYKFQSKNMIAIGVQIQGTLLTKNVFTGDNCWGVRWQQVSESLKCYALGDIQVGFVSYNVLVGLLPRDVFLDPDVLCRVLKFNQKTAADWFLEKRSGIKRKSCLRPGKLKRMRMRRLKLVLLLRSRQVFLHLNLLTIEPCLSNVFFILLFKLLY